jgi:exonuclease SbcD
LARVRGTESDITQQLQTLAQQNTAYWVEVVCTGELLAGDLSSRLNAVTADSLLEILSIKNERLRQQVLNQSHSSESLDDLSVNEVFERCLSLHAVPEAQRAELRSSYQLALNALYDQQP